MMNYQCSLCEAEYVDFQKAEQCCSDSKLGLTSPTNRVNEMMRGMATETKQDRKLASAVYQTASESNVTQKATKQHRLNRLLQIYPKAS